MYLNKEKDYYIKLSFNKELIMEDIEFIREHVNELTERHPIIEEETGLLLKIARRLIDIEERVKEA